jgi:signal transduction histidine kinase
MIDIKALPDLVFVFDKDGKLLEYNNKASSLLEGIGIDIKSVSFNTFGDYFNYLLDENEEFDNIDIKLENNNKELVLLMSFSKHEGNVYLAGKDLTAIAAIEEEIQADRASLIESSKKNKLAEVTGWLCHDIRNPLMVIQGGIFKMKNYLATMENQEISSGVLPIVDRIQNSVNKIEKSVYQKYESYQRDNVQVDHFVDVKLIELLEGVLGSKEEELRNSAIKTTIDCDKNAVVKTNDKGIVAVLAYLLDNSIEALSDSSGDRWIKIEAKVEGNNVDIYFNDSGPGIEEKFSEQIFRPFYTTKLNGKHVGTGLTRSQKIATDLGWVLKYNQGHPNTSFKLSIMAS